MILYGTVRIVGSPCPTCGQFNDAAGSTVPGATPKPGDIAVCVKCRAVNEFDDELRLVTADMSVFDAETIEFVNAARGFIARRQPS